MPDDPPPWMGQFQATLTGIQTQLGAVQAQVTGVENQLGGIRTDLVAFRNQTTQSLLRLEHAQKQAATRVRSIALRCVLTLVGPKPCPRRVWIRHAVRCGRLR